MELRGADHSAIATFDTETETLAAASGWTAIENDFSEYGAGVRYIYFELNGAGAGIWGGPYGTVLMMLLLLLMPLPTCHFIL